MPNSPFLFLFLVRCVDGKFDHMEKYTNAFSFKEQKCNCPVSVMDLFWQPFCGNFLRNALGRTCLVSGVRFQCSLSPLTDINITKGMASAASCSCAWKNIFSVSCCLPGLSGGPSTGCCRRLLPNSNSVLLDSQLFANDWLANISFLP